ncbi:MAG: T9SS type A sorting domain-containing protein [bacterium]
MNIKKLATILLFISSFTVFASDYWIEANNGISELSISSIAINSNDDIFATNNGTGIWLSQNFGTNWTQVNYGLELSVIKIAVNSRDVLFAGTAGKGIFRSTNNGASWIKIKDCLDTNHYIRSIIFDKDDNIFISIDYEGVFYSNNDGDDWRDFGFSNLSQINSLVLTNNDVFIAGTQDRGMWKTSNYGNTWDSIACPSPTITSLLVNARGTVFAGNANGKIYRSINDGNSWDERASLYYHINQMIETKEGVIYAVIDTNGPYHSFDFGDKWGHFTYGKYQRTVYSICANSRDTLYFGTENGVFKTVLDTLPLNPPNLVLPMDNAKDIQSDVELSWYRCRAAEEYEVAVSYYSTFSKLFLQTIVPDNFCNIINLDLNTNFYWKVRSIRHNDTSSWSDVRRLNTKLNAPLQISPENEARNLDTNIVLNWEEVDNADYYWLQIYGYVFGELKLMYSEKQLTSTSYTFNTECDNTYYWRLKSINQESESDWSGYFKFITKLAPPVLISPSDNSKDLPDEILFEWVYNKEFTYYYFDFEIATDSNFINIFYTDPNIRQNSTTVDNFEFGNKYYWRVKAKEGVSIGYWSKIYSFETGTEPPELISPINNSIGQALVVQLDWNYVKPYDNFSIEIYKDTPFETLIINDSTITSKSYNLNSLDYGTNYYWRVRAKQNDEWTLWSDRWKFSTGFKEANLLHPLNNSFDNTLPVLFIWNIDIGFDSTKIQISTDSVFQKVDFEKVNKSVTSDTVSILDDGQSYYWRVLYYKEDKISFWSEIWKFTTHKFDLEAPTLLYPPKDTTEIDTSIYVFWSAPNSSSTYHLQLSDEESFFNPKYDIDSLTENFCLISGLSYNTKYDWRVKSKKDSLESQWSEIFSFTTKDGIGIEDFSIYNDDYLFDVRICPNPILENLKILITTRNNLKVNIAIYNLLGNQVVKIDTPYNSIGFNEIAFNTKALSNGIYYLVITTENHNYRKMFIINK